MHFTQIGTDCFGDESALAAVAAANDLCAATEAEHAAIDAETKAVVESALTADPEDAPKLLKSAAALRLRTLRVLLTESRVMPLKMAAETAVKSAASTRHAQLEHDLAEIESRLATAARGLGYKDGDVMWHRVFHADESRRTTKDALSAARTAMHKTRFVTDEDQARATAGLRAEIGQALR